MKLDTVETEAQEEKLEKKRYTILTLLILSVSVIPVFLISLIQKVSVADVAGNLVLSVLGCFILLFYISIEPEGILEKAYSPWLIGICLFLYLMVVKVGNETPWIMVGLFGAMLLSRMLNRNLGLVFLFSQIPFLLFSGIASDRLLYFLLTGMLLCLLTGQADSLINLFYSCIMVTALQLTLIIAQNGFDISEIFSSGYPFMLLIGVALLPVGYGVLCLFPEEKETISMEILDEALMQEFIRNREKNKEPEEKLSAEYLRVERSEPEPSAESLSTERNEPESSAAVSEFMKQRVRESVFSIPPKEEKQESPDRLSELIRSFRADISPMITSSQFGEEDMRVASVSLPEVDNSVKDSPLERLFQEMNARKAEEKYNYNELNQTDVIEPMEDSQEWKQDLSESTSELQNAWSVLKDIIKTEEPQQQDLEASEPEGLYAMEEPKVEALQVQAEELQVEEELIAEEDLVAEELQDELERIDNTLYEEIEAVMLEAEELDAMEEPKTEKVPMEEEPAAEELQDELERIDNTLYEEIEAVMLEAEELDAMEEAKEVQIEEEPAAELQVEEELIVEDLQIEEPVAEDLNEAKESESQENSVKLLELLNKKSEDELLKEEENLKKENERVAKKKRKQLARKSAKKAVKNLQVENETVEEFSQKEVESLPELPMPDHTLMEVVQPEFPLLLKMQKEAPKMYLQCRKTAELASRGIEVIDGDKELTFAGGMYCKLHKLSDGIKPMDLRMMMSENRIPMQLVLLTLQFASAEKPSSREMCVISITEDILSAIAYTKMKSEKVVSHDKIIDNVFKLRYSQKMFAQAGMSIKDYTGLKRFFNSEFED